MFGGGVDELTGQTKGAEPKSTDRLSIIDQTLNPGARVIHTTRWPQGSAIKRGYCHVP